MRPFYPEIVVAGVTDVPRVDHGIYCDDIVIQFRGGSEKSGECGVGLREQPRSRTLPKTDVYNQTRTHTEKIRNGGQRSMANAVMEIYVKTL
jgi:hypothetical protein